MDFNNRATEHGEYVSATKLQNTIKEIMMEGSLYNLF